jgi:hypothetical protein
MILGAEGVRWYNGKSRAAAGLICIPMKVTDDICAWTDFSEFKGCILP